MVSCWELKQSKVHSSDKGLEEDSLEQLHEGLHHLEHSSPTNK